MHWLFLFIAGLLEVTWAVGLKYSVGFTKLIPSALTLTAMTASVYFLALAMKTIPLGTAYPIWTAIGAVGTVILGIILFNEPINAMRLFFIFLIVVGVVGLQLSTSP